MSFVPTATAVLNHWVRILAALEKKINRQSFETWLKPTRFSRVEGPNPLRANPLQRLSPTSAIVTATSFRRPSTTSRSTSTRFKLRDPAEGSRRHRALREDGGFAPLPSHSPNAPRSGSSTPAHRPRAHPGQPHRAPGAQPPSRPASTGPPPRSSTPNTSSTPSSSAPATSSPWPPRKPSPSVPPRPTTPSSSTAASAWARPTSCTPSATT